MDGRDESHRSLHLRLMDRFHSLESSYHKLNHQFQLLQEKTRNGLVTNKAHRGKAKMTSDFDNTTSLPGRGSFSDAYFFWSPYKSVLECMGHAVYVSRAGSGEIVYWNCAAENLYGYKDYEVLGQSIVELLFDEKHRPSVLAIMERLIAGESWSGQLPIRNRSYESIVAIVSKSPLYEDGELVWIVTVSCDAASAFNNTISENTTTHQTNFKKIQPEVVRLLGFPSISNLASKVLPRKHASDRESEEGEVEGQVVRANKPPRVPAAKVLSKLKGGAISNSDNENIQQKGLEENIASVDCEDASPKLSEDSCNVLSPVDYFGSGTRSSLSKGNSELDVVVNSEIRLEDLKLREEIGKGSFAVVYHGVWNGSDVAVKVYSGSRYSEETLLDYKKEIDIMRRLRHPNVLLFMGAVCSEEKLAMVTEYLARGSLFRTLHRGSQSLDMRRRLMMAIDVARGMHYLHHRNPPIVHRDLKSSNLLVDKSWTVKVGDFGLSKLKDATYLTANSGRGTPQWMAPEVLRNEHSTEKSDIFSFGVILWELMTRRVPWNDLNPFQVVGVVGFMDGRLDIPENIDPHVSSIISDCWQSNPEDRPSFEDIINKMKDLVTTKMASTP